jgi:hypothetical protein
MIVQSASAEQPLFALANDLSFSSWALQSLMPPSADGQMPLTDQVAPEQRAVIREPLSEHE